MIYDEVIELRSKLHECEAWLARRQDEINERDIRLATAESRLDSARRLLELWLRWDGNEEQNVEWPDAETRHWLTDSSTLFPKDIV